LESKTRERNEIISIAICPYEKYLAVITGKNLIKNEQKPNQIFIFKREIQEGSDKEEKDKFLFSKKVVIADTPELQGICMDFHFKKNQETQKADCLYFAQKDRIIKYYFKRHIASVASGQRVDSSKWLVIFYKFGSPLNKQPDFFKLDPT
jgi:hypothetical protein